MSNGQEGMYDSGLKGMLEIFVDLILCVIGHDEDTKMELCEQLHFCWILCQGEPSLPTHDKEQNDLDKEMADIEYRLNSSDYEKS